MIRALGLRRRISYLLARARAINIKNVWRIARAASRLSRKPAPLIVVDLLWCAVVYEAAFQDYLDWDFVTLTRAERRTFMTHPKSNHLVRKLNDPTLSKIFSDKSQFNLRFGAYLGREWLDIRTVSVEELTDFLRRHERVMVKVPDGIWGLGIEARQSSTVTDVAAFRDELIGKRQFLVEEFITQHAEMVALNSSSVNTLRVISYLDDARVHILAAALKIGNGKVIDNFSGGGMYTMLDETGTAHVPAFDETGACYAIHPLTGTSIVGFTVPSYDRVLTLVDELAWIVPEVPYLGWDIALGVDGPLVIEGNANSGVYQSKPSVSGARTGLLPRYRAVIGF